MTGHENIWVPRTADNVNIQTLTWSTEVHLKKKNRPFFPPPTNRWSNKNTCYIVWNNMSQNIHLLKTLLISCFMICPVYCTVCGEHLFGWSHDESITIEYMDLWWGDVLLLVAQTWILHFSDSWFCSWTLTFYWRVNTEWSGRGLGTDSTLWRRFNLWISPVKK